MRRAPSLERVLDDAAAPAVWLDRLPPGPGRCALDPGRSSAPAWGSGIAGGAPLGLLAHQPEIVFRGGLDALRNALRWLDPHPERPALDAVLIGALHYELGADLDLGGPPPLRSPDPGEPQIWLAGYRAVYRFDPARGRGVVTGGDGAAVRALAEHLRARPAERDEKPVALGDPRPAIPDAEFIDKVIRIQRYIEAGDVYQVNLSRRLEWNAPETAHPEILFRTLQREAPAPFAAYLDTASGAVLSNSPERFLRVEGSRVQTCPIKGTRPRGHTAQRDRELAQELLHSLKERAEHVMIVDLERNDLGRICRTSSVCVRDLARRITLPTVHHMVSSVVGELREGIGWLDILRATFPGGSITGAPKLRAMQILQEIEPAPRGVYTGAIGYFDARGDADLSIAIRTAVLARGRLTLPVGGGIVADSDPRLELHETWHKARAFTAVLAGD